MAKMVGANLIPFPLAHQEETFESYRKGSELEMESFFDRYRRKLRRLGVAEHRIQKAIDDFSEVYMPKPQSPEDRAFDDWLISVALDPNISPECLVSARRACRALADLGHIVLRMKTQSKPSKRSKAKLQSAPELPFDAPELHRPLAAA